VIGHAGEAWASIWSFLGLLGQSLSARYNWPDAPGWVRSPRHQCLIVHLHLLFIF
jgi:hypothetical protein